MNNTNKLENIRNQLRVIQSTQFNKNKVYRKTRFLSFINKQNDILTNPDYLSLVSNFETILASYDGDELTHSQINIAINKLCDDIEGKGE